MFHKQKDPNGCSGTWGGGGEEASRVPTENVN